MNRKPAKQELFDIVVAHIEKQGGPSVDENGDCMYQSPDGKSCAARPFITNYRPAMESEVWSELTNRFPGDLDPDAVDEWEFVEELQLCHDWNSTDGNSPFLERWRKSMKQLADRYNLEYTP